jgi:hypothetical protein
MTKHSKRILFVKCGKTLPEELLLAFKAGCSRRNKSMTRILAQLMREWLRGKEE